MTPREFHDAVTPLLDVRTFEPFVLAVGGGAVVHVDHPEELQPTTPGRYRLRRRRGDEPETPIEVKDVVAVTPLERYEGGEGERFIRFRDTIRSLLRAEPFTPFEIELKSADRLRVEAPNRLAMSGRFALVTKPDRRFVVFSDADVARITPLEVPANAG